MEFKDIFKKFRKNLDLSQKDLAEELKVSPSLISQWELGVCTPNFPMLEQIAEFFKTDINTLLDFTTGQEIAFKQGLRDLNLDQYKTLSENDRKLLAEQFNALIDRLQKNK